MMKKELYNAAAGGAIEILPGGEKESTMEKALYNAAAGGETDILRGFKSEDIESQETPLKNTVLHVAVQVASARNKEKTVKAAIEKICDLCPSLIRRQNSKGDTPLHIAARGGLYDVVKQLIDKKYDVGSSKSHHENENGSVLRMVNLKGDTALHEALRNHHLFDRKYQAEYSGVVQTLIAEDAELSNLINKVGESPVFIAAGEGLYDSLKALLDTSKVREYGGPGRRTALHAAVQGEKIGEDDILQVKTGGMTRKKDVIGLLMERRPDLIKEEDEYNRTPLHYAANFHEKVKRLLERVRDEHKSFVYHRDKNGMTALHYAASSGANKSIDVLIENCPDCFEQVDSRGWTTLHFAVAGERSRSDDSTIKYIIKNKNGKLRSISMAMVNQREDNNGDTPLHLAARFSNYDALSFLMDFPQVDIRALNNQHLTALDIFQATGMASNVMVLDKKSLEMNLKKKTGSITSQAPMLAIKDTQGGGKEAAPENKKEVTPEKEDRDKAEIGKLREIELLVATLIATVTFAASITMPGGYNGNPPDEGMATLSSEAAFQLFVIANTGAMALSTAAIFTHLNAVMTMLDRYKFDRSFNKANLFIVIAMIGMVIAFVAGTYLVLANNPPLAIRTTVIGCFLFFGTVGPSLLLSLTKYWFKYLYEKVKQILWTLCCCCCCCCFIRYFCKKGDSNSKAGDQEEKKSAHEV